MEYRDYLRHTTPQEHDYVLAVKREELNHLRQNSSRKSIFALAIVNTVIGIIALFSRPFIGFTAILAAIICFRSSYYDYATLRKLKQQILYLYDGRYKVFPVTGFDVHVHGTRTAYCFYGTDTIFEFDDNPVALPYCEAKRLTKEGNYEFPLLLLSFPGETAMPACPAPRVKEGTTEGFTERKEGCSIHYNRKMAKETKYISCRNNPGYDKSV